MYTLTQFFLPVRKYFVFGFIIFIVKGKPGTYKIRKQLVTDKIKYVTSGKPSNLNFLAGLLEQGPML